MSTLDPSPVIAPSRASRAACGACLATVSALMFLWAQPVAARSTQATVEQAEVAMAVVPLVAAEFVAVPAVTCPLETVARFSPLPLDTVAGVVDIARSREVGLMRFGGRCGP